MNPNDFASVFMLTAGAMLFVGGVSGFVLGRFLWWFNDRQGDQQGDRRGGDRKKQSK